MMSQSWCGRCDKFDCSQCPEQYSNSSVYPNGLNHDNYDQYQHQIGTYTCHNSTTLLDVFGGSASVGRDLHAEPSSDLAASGSQYPQFANSQTMFWDNTPSQVRATEAEAPSELLNTHSVEPSQPSVWWGGATNSASSVSQQHTVADHGSLPQWDTQYPDYSQFPTFPSIDNLVGPAQTIPFQEDLGINYAPSSAEQYLLDIEQREGDALSIHLRIPPSIPGAMYYGTHLMSEFSQQADGTIDVRVHLPAEYARVSSTFMHA